MAPKKTPPMMLDYTMDVTVMTTATATPPNLPTRCPIFRRLAQTHLLKRGPSKRTLIGTIELFAA
jgi:hypothetical protein